MTPSIWLNYFSTTVAPILIQKQQEESLVQRHFVIANKNVRINCSNTLVAEKFSPSLLHLKAPHFDDADLDIFVWQRDDFGTLSYPSITEGENNLNETELIHQFNEQSISIYDPIKKQAFFWVNSLEQLGDWNYAKPFRVITHWFLSQHALSMIHGAVVGTDEGAVLITAKGGSGKTTTALSCFLEGLNYLSDDYVAIDTQNPTAFSLYNSAMLTEDNVKRFPQFEGYIQNKSRPEGIKALVYLNDINPSVMRAESKLKAIFIPRISHSQKTEIIATKKVAALMAIAPTIRSLRNFEQEKLSAAKQLSEELPCFELRLSNDMQEIATTIRTFIDTYHA